MSAQALREEHAYIATLVAERAAYDLWKEQEILREALEVATTRQRKQISAMINTIERRMAEIEDDEAAVILLM